MSVIPFLIAIALIVIVALILTFLVGLNPEERKNRSFTHRTRNLLLIYGLITFVLLIAFFAYLQFG